MKGQFQYSSILAFTYKNASLISSENNPRFPVQNSDIETVRPMIIIYGILSFYALLLQQRYSRILTDYAYLAA